VQRSVAKVASFVYIDASLNESLGGSEVAHLATQWSALSPSLLVAFTSEKSVSAKSAVPRNRANIVWSWPLMSTGLRHRLSARLNLLNRYGG